jgi:hypothetical protein
MFFFVFFLRNWNGHGHSSRNVSSGWSLATATQWQSQQTACSNMHFSFSKVDLRRVVDGEKRNSRMCTRMELKRFSPRVDEKISNMSRPSVSNPHECVHVVHPTPEKSEVAEKCCWSKQLERNSFVTHQQLGTHTEGGGDERKRATGVLNPQKNKNKFLTHRNNWSKLFLECIALKFPGLNICCCFSTSKEEEKKTPNIRF